MKNDNIIIPKRWMIKKPVGFVDYLSCFLWAVASIGGIISESWFFLIISICFFVVEYSVILKGEYHLNIKPFEISSKNLFEIKNGDNTEYLIADSIDEANLYCEFEKINDSPNYIGKAKHFV